MENKTAMSHWVEYNFDKIESRPKEYGKYLVSRKDGKIHWETWNGSGWAYNSNVITHWAVILPVNSVSKSAHPFEDEIKDLRLRLNESYRINQNIIYTQSRVSDLLSKALEQLREEPANPKYIVSAPNYYVSVDPYKEDGTGKVVIFGTGGEFDARSERYKKMFLENKPLWKIKDFMPIERSALMKSLAEEIDTKLTNLTKIPIDRFDFIKDKPNNNNMQKRNPNDQSQMVPAELAIDSSLREIEKLGADKRLSTAQMYLGYAKRLVSSYIDKEDISGVEDLLPKPSSAVKPNPDTESL